MPSATSRISFLDALLRPHRRSQRKADLCKTLSASEQRAAARYRAVADAPIPEETRLRAERQVSLGAQPVIHLRRVV
jgi:hypothetical protein